MENRCEPRYPAPGDTVVVTVRNAREDNRSQATLINISKSGFALATRRPLAPGADLLVVLDRLSIFGVVRRCDGSASEGYTIGVEITSLEPANEAA